jgi:PAS domain S-box-containing protein
MFHRVWCRITTGWANIPLRRKGLVVVVLPLLALLLTSAASVGVQRRSGQATDLVAHTLEVQSEVQRTTILLLDAVIGSRGYLLTRSEETLQPFLHAQATLPQSLDRLAALTADNPAQVARMARVRELSTRQLTILNSLRSSVVGPDGAVPPAIAALLAENETLMAQVRVELDAMQAEEQRLLTERRATVDERRDRGALTVAISLPVGLVGGALAMVLFTTGVVGRIRRVEENAASLARRDPLIHPPVGKDEIGQLARGLEEASLLLASWESELRAARAFQEHLIAASPGLIYRASLKPDQANYVSPNVEQLLGFTPDDVLATPSFWRDHIHPADLPETQKAALALVEARQTQVECEQRLVSKDGEYHWFYSIMRLERDEDDTPATLLTYSVDISGRKQAEAALQQAKDDLELRVAERTSELNATNAHLAARQEELERLTATLQAQTHNLTQQAAQLAEANRDLAQKNDENEMFVYSVSHDLRSPLVNLQGFSQELALVTKDLRALLTAPGVPQATRDEAIGLLDGDIGDSLRFIQAAVSRLAAIIDALLRLSRAGRLEYQWRMVDTATVVSRIVDAMHETIEARGAEVIVGALPPAWGDPTAVEQIFANLIGNALNYLDPQRPGQIEVCCAPPHSDLAKARPACHVYSVRDNGLGIPEHAREKVFQIFQRLHPQAASGEGLGLALVRRIVERHHGAIWVESTEGKGSTFFVALPQQAGGANGLG